MGPGTKIALGASAVIALLLLLTGDAKAAPQLPPPPPPPPQPPPLPTPPVVPLDLPPLPKPPTLIGDKMAITTHATKVFTLPGVDTTVVEHPMPSNVVVKVLSIGYTFPGKGEWSKVLVPASTSWVLFDLEKNVVGFVPSDALNDPRAWTPATIPDLE